MPPVGNDIVDLRETGNCGKSGDGRFVDRVFTPEERDRIAGASCPDKLLWAFWAAKEAAYKAVSRDDPPIHSIPRRYRVVLDDQEAGKAVDATAISEDRLAGRVITPGGEAALWIMVTDDYVHALATSGDGDPASVVHRVDVLDPEKEAGGASAFVRRQLLFEMALRLECPVGDLAIRKESSGPGAPSVFLRGLPLTAEISLSHDGRFTAFAFRLPR